MWLAATHYFESEIINKLITHIKIHREAIKSKTLERKHFYNVFIIYSVRFSILYKNCKTRSIFNCSNNSLLVCSLIEFKNNYLREYNSQLSAVCPPVQVSHLFLVKFMLLKKMLNLQNVSEERKMPNIHG